MADQSVAKVEVPLVTVRSEDSVTTVPTWPMPLIGVNDRTVELEKDLGDVLVLGPRRGTWRVGIIMVLCAIIPGLFGVGLTMYLMLQEVSGFGRVIWWGGMLLMAVLLGLVVLSETSKGNWVRFDSRDGIITQSRRPFGFFRAPRIYQTIPLAEVACIQLIYNGFHNEDREIGDGDRKTYQVIRYHAYQMNLVLKRGDQSRINLAHHSDWQWMRSTGGQLAEYLHMALVDQLYHN
jgi:hypothetical protein